MLVSLTVGKVDAGVTVLLTPDKRLIEFPSILLPPNIGSGSIVDITVSRNNASESKAESSFRELQDRIYSSFGSAAPQPPVLRCRNATQTSVVLEWDPIVLATSDLISLSMYRNGQKAGAIPRPLDMHSTKISGLAVDTEYTFHLVLRTTAGTHASERIVVRTHKMTDLSGITITTGIMPATMRDALAQAVDRIGAKIVDGVRIDTTHFVTTEGRGLAWEKAVEMNIPVVRPEWVNACETKGRILGVTQFYLDAMRPAPEEMSSPVSVRSPQQLQSPRQEKQLPPEPSNGALTEETDEKAAQKKEEAVSPVESDSEEEPAEQKVKVADPDEQKVRLEDKEDIPMRPAQLEPSKPDKEESEKEDKSPGDETSFQDVDL